MDQKAFWTQFPLGSHLCREPMPAMNEMKRDMDILKSKGFNLIKLQENWMLDEPVEGEYHFDKYHELIGYARKLDMGVYLGLTCEQAPNWLWEKHPSCRMQLRDGRKLAYQAQSTLPADGKQGPCYDDPGAMADQLRFIRKLVTELGQHENIVVWNTWQEIAYWGEGHAGDKVCYCPNTIKAYRKWVSGLYDGDIDALNDHWNVRYASFSSIEPDRAMRTQCIPQSFYFHYFMENVQIVNVLVSRCEAIKKADPLGRQVFAHKGSPELASGVDWTYARTQDFLGTSNYPAWGSGSPWDDHKQHPRLPRHESLLCEVWDNLAYRMDHIRSLSKSGAPVWAAEYQGGPVSTDYHLGRVPSADDMRRWMLTTMGAGATAIAFWVTRAEIMAPETNGFSLLDSEGDSTERFEEAARIGSALQGYPDIFSVNNKPQADVAILLDEWKYRLMNCLSFAPDAHRYDVRGWYKLLWDKGISCDFIEASQLGEEKTSRYKTIIVPMPLSISDKVAKGIISYVQSGGNVIIEGGCGRLDEVAYAVRGQMNPAIRAALDVKVERFAHVHEPGDSNRWMPPEYTWGEYEQSGFLEGTGFLKGSRLKANMFIEVYTAGSGEVCFYWNGKPAGIIQDTGKGKFILIGTCVGPNGTAYIETDSHDSVGRILALCGVSSKHIGKLLIAERIGENRKALIITNPHKETVTEEIAIPENSRISDILGGEVSVSEDKVAISVEPLDVRVLVVSSRW